MGSEPHARTTTRRLLFWGIVVGPFYLTVGLAQALLRDGFDFARHPLSLLANGPGGWIQTINFVLSGLMVVAAAAGLARVLRPHSRTGGWFLGAFGVSMLLAAVFPADPVDGFPPGTPEGFPETMTTPGMLHFVFGSLGFLALAVSCFVIGRALSKRGDSGLARLSIVAGATVVLGFFGPAFLPIGPTAGIWVSVVVGWAWLAVVSGRLRGGTGLLYRRTARGEALIE